MKRSERRDSYLEWLKQYNGCEYDDAVYRYSFESGLSPTTVRSYLRELERGGQVKIREEEKLIEEPVKLLNGRTIQTTYTTPIMRIYVTKQPESPFQEGIEFWGLLEPEV